MEQIIWKSVRAHLPHGQLDHVILISEAEYRPALYQSIPGDPLESLSVTQIYFIINYVSKRAANTRWTNVSCGERASV